MDKEKLEKAVESLLSREDMDLVDFVCGKYGNKSILQFFIDRKEGKVTLDDCERMSNKISATIDMENLVEGGYVIEVSSPGVYRALKKPEHFKRFSGQRAKVHLKNPVGGQNMFVGEISVPEEGKVAIKHSQGEIVVSFDEIGQAKLDPNLEI
ncbi:MAG: ribosome maturation factor RimP [Elusimicrobia bacterium]|nr:ribosome maturation factor RimP [Elusimicrobiota bacterium]